MTVSLTPLSLSLPFDKRAVAEMNELCLLAFGEYADKLKPREKSTAGIGTGPAAQGHRDATPAKDEAKRPLGFRMPMSEHQMIGVAAKLEAMSVKDFCMK